jgi:hypothetical protein
MVHLLWIVFVLLDLDELCSINGFADGATLG